MKESELSPQVQENIEKMDIRGKELQTIEDMYLDGKYDLESIKRRLQMSKAIIGQHIYFMGRDLVILKENCKQGQFIPHLNDIGINVRTAQRYMGVAIKFNSPKLQQLVGNLNNEKGLFSKLVDLSTEADEELESLIDGGTIAGLQLDDIDRMSPTEVRKALRKERDNSQEDKEANDRLMAEKNDRMDKLSKKLARSEGTPIIDRWPDQVAVLDEALGQYAHDAEKVTFAVLQVVKTMGNQLGEEVPDSALKALAIESLSRANRLQSLVAELQSEVFSVFSEYIQEPTYKLSDPLEMLDDDQERS